MNMMMMMMMMIIIIIIIIIMGFLSLSCRYNSEIREKWGYGTRQNTFSVLSSSRLAGYSSVMHATGRGVRIVSDLHPEGIRTVTESPRKKKRVIFSPK